VLLTGYKGGMIRKYCGGGKRFGMRMEYSAEREPLGTGGALLNSKEKLSGTLLVMNGDSFLDFDVKKFFAFHKKKRALATVFAMRGDLTARGVVEADGSGRVKKFLEKQRGGRGVFNTGAYLIEEEAVGFFADLIAKGKLPRAFSMEKDGFPLLAKKRKLFAYVGQGHFLDMGTFDSLSRAKGFLSLALGKAKGTPAIFFDRDGVINKVKNDYVRHEGQFHFQPGALDGISEMSKLGLPIFVVTNQSMVGRGISTNRALGAIHRKMLRGLRQHGVRVKDVFICPHRPERNCICRKPKIGMLVKAQDRYRIDLAHSFVIGDSSGDILMGNVAGCTTILVRTGYGGKDGKYDALPHFTARNLKEAAKIVKKEIALRKK
jgi:histidinol-phosphate phosphatase family protein